VNIYVEAIGFGVVTASIIAIGAMGFSLQFGLTNVFNISYGAVLTLGAFAALLAEHAGITGWFDVLIGAGVGIVSTWLIGKGALSFFARRRAGLFELVTVSLAIELIVQYGVDAIDHEQLYNYFFNQGRSLHFLGMVFTVTQLEIIGVALAAFVVLEGTLRITKLGKALRAVAEEPRLARACGIKTSGIVNFTWVVSGALAGIAGVVYIVNSLSVSAFTGTDVLPLFLAAAILGRAGSLAGAVLASLVIGLVMSLVAATGGSAYSTVAGFGILVLVLIARPGGVTSGLALKTETTL
jgi:branched-chain amino acid transport system permease protein/neutral amino acid transport system permease protein